MTTINWLLRPDRLHFYTDGAVYDADGILSGVAGKCISAPNLPALFMSRGAALADCLIAHDFSMRFSDFDNMLDGIENELPRVLGAYSRLLRAQPEIQLIFGGWSARRKRPEAYFIALDDSHLAKGYEAYGNVIAPEVGKKTQLRGGGGLPCLTPEDVALGWITPPKTADEVGSDIADYARTVLELHRRKKFPNEDESGEHHIVGGLGELTTLTKDKIETQIICRWPDEIGQPITPAPVDWGAWRARQRRGAAPALSLVSSAPQGLNRQQRRAWEAQNKRRV